MRSGTKQAVILCGGVGSRLGKLVANIPKPMLEIEGQPLIRRTIGKLRDAGFNDFLLAAGYQGEVIKDHFQKTPIEGISVATVIESEPLGTAGPLRLLGSQLSERFLLVYGDVFLDLDANELWDAHVNAASPRAATLLVRASDHPWDSDLVTVDAEDGCRVTGFLRAGEPRHHPRNLANAAIYVLDKSLVGYVPEYRKTDFVADLFPAALQHGEVIGAHKWSGDGFIKDMGTPERLAKVGLYLKEKEWAERSRQNRNGNIETVFLDRDGVLNEDRADLIDEPDQIRLLPGVGEAVARLNQAGIKVVVITNQPVIARGQCDEFTLLMIHKRLEEELQKSGGHLDRIYYCPHHPETHHSEGVTELRVACNCRKPAPGLIFQAARDMDIDLSKSVMIGDRECDMVAAERAGVLGVFIGDREHNLSSKRNAVPFQSMPAAVDSILAKRQI